VIRNECPFINDRVTTISGHFFAICIFIFHKTEVQTVILRCLTGLNLNWFKSYGVRCNLRPKASLANSPKIATDKRPLYNHIWPFFLLTTWFSFTKLRFRDWFLMSLNFNWYKSYDTKRKNSKNTNLCFWTKLQKKRKWKYFRFVS
jgi:hypothetical protein